MKKFFWVGLVALLVGALFNPFLLAQGKWSKTDERNVERFHHYGKLIREQALKNDWKRAAKLIETQEWYINRWKKAHRLSHPKIAELVKILEANKKMIQEQKVPTAKAAYYVNYERGVARKGGTKENPDKFLWMRLNNLAEGAEIHISGPIFGWRRSGKLPVIKTSHLSFKGGYNSDFSEWDPVKYPTVFQKEKGSTASMLQRQMMSFEKGTGLVLDGIVFDQKSINIYGPEGNLDLAHSVTTPIVRIMFTGDVVIRNCVFLNSSLGGLRLIAKGPGKVIVENCVFINCVHFGIDIMGVDKKASSTFIIRNNTFVNMIPFRGSLGTGVNVGSLGTVEIRNNIFAYSDVAVTSLRSNNRISLVGNRAHCLNTAFYYYSEGSKVSKVQVGPSLEEVDLKGELEGNSNGDPKLNLDPVSALKYLKSTLLFGLKKEVLQKEIAYYEDLAKSAGVKKEEKKEPEKKDPEKKKKSDDPFGGGFDDGNKKPADKKPADKKPADTNDLVPTAKYFGQAYPFEKGWVFSGQEDCKAGAKQPK